jgi:hypothetical protein
LQVWRVVPTGRRHGASIGGWGGDLRGRHGTRAATVQGAPLVLAKAKIAGSNPARATSSLNLKSPLAGALPCWSGPISCGHRTLLGVRLLSNANAFNPNWIGENLRAEPFFVGAHVLPWSSKPRAGKGLRKQEVGWPARYRRVELNPNQCVLGIGYPHGNLHDRVGPIRSSGSGHLGSRKRRRLRDLRCEFALRVLDHPYHDAPRLINRTRQH